MTPGHEISKDGGIKFILRAYGSVFGGN